MNAHLKELTATTIGALLKATADAALVQHADGSLDVVPSLSADPVPDTTVILRHPARQWADELVDAARDEAETRGTSTHHRVLHAAAAAEARAELAAELEREVVPTPPAAPLVPEGHVLITTAQLAAWAALLDELEPLVLTHRLSA